MVEVGNRQPKSASDIQTQAMAHMPNPIIYNNNILNRINDKYIFKTLD